MFLQRNIASQVFTIPGTLRVIADGSAATSGATLTWVKDGTSGASAGTLTHVSDGAYTYQPTQGETDAKICGWVLSKTGAAGLCGSVRTTNADPNDGTRLALTALPNATAGTNTGLAVVGSQIPNANAAAAGGLSIVGSAMTLAASQHVIVDSGTITTLTNLPAIPTNWITATGINAGALNGKGDWLLAGSYIAPDNADIAAIKTVTDKLSFDGSNHLQTTLVSSGLDAIPVTDPGVVANMTTYPKMMIALWRSVYKKSTMTATQMKMYADDGSTVNATSTVSDDGTVQTKGAAA